MRILLKPRYAIVLVAVWLAACAAPGPARQSVRDALSAADYAVMAAATQDALEGRKIGEGLNWSNPDSQHLGTVTPTRTYTSQAGQDCREYQTTVTVEARTEIRFANACRGADGTWVETADPVPVYVAGTPRYRYRYAPYYDDYYGHPYYGYGYHYGYGHHYGLFHYGHYGHLGFGHHFY